MGCTTREWARCPPLPPALRTLLIVSHTHWDREWYSPFEEFRWRLVETVDQLLDLMEKNPKYAHFTLDGQTVVLDDYLAIRPGNRERLERLVKADRLHVGPWYVLADEFLVSGESLVRNLLFGHQIAESFGAVMPIGHVPDTFGHIAQLPQVLRGFDMGSSVFWRGLEDHGKSLPTELRWRAPDGSEVLAAQLGIGYGPAARLEKTVDGALAQLLAPMSVLVPRATSSALLLMNGSDHQPPQPHLPELLVALNARIRTGDILGGKTLTQLFRDYVKQMTGHDVLESGAERGALEGVLSQFFGPAVKAMQGSEFRHGTLMDYFDTVRREVDITKLPIIHGEQHSSKHISVLPGVFSTRLYLKQANFASQTLLERWAEPFATIAWWLGAGYPDAWLRRAWQLLMQNHPHDSICGCGVDAIHNDMLGRFAWVQELGNRVLSKAIAHINEQASSPVPVAIANSCLAALRVFNPHNWNRTDVIRAVVTLPQAADVKNAYTLFDADGNAAPCQTTPASRINPVLAPIIEQHALPASVDGEPPAPNPSHQLLLTFVAHEVPALGYQTYYLAAGASKRVSSKPVKVDLKTHVAENDALKLSISPADGSVTVHHKPSGRRFGRLLSFEDTGDVGDEYNYCPPAKDSRMTTQQAKRPTLRLIEQGPVAVTWEIDTTLAVPASADHAHSCRSAETTQIPVRSLVSLYAGVPRVDVTTALTNTATDHRLRVLFPTKLKTDTAWADTPFYVNERPLGPAPQEWADQLLPTIMDMFLTYFWHQSSVPGKHPGWFEDSTTTHAQQTFVDVTDGQSGLMVASRGLPEYEVLQDPERTIAVTLIRAVGWLSRGDLTTRRGNAGPSLPTPGAQWLGSHIYHYSVIPHAGTWREHATIHSAHAFAAPLRALQTVPGKTGTLPQRHSFLSIEPDNLLLSALKKAEKGDASILRFYETSGKRVSATVQSGVHLNRVSTTNLGEVEQRDPSLRLPNDSDISVNVDPFQVKTVLLELKPSK
jgi:mannosylglycerate hydrolase